MSVLVVLFVRVVSIILYALEIFMLARAVSSWLPFDEDAPLIRFLYSVTEPFILPVRKLLERSEIINSMPFDLSFMVTYFLLILVQFLLPTVRV